MATTRMPRNIALLVAAFGAFTDKRLPKEAKAPTRTHGNAFAHTDAIRLQRAEAKRARRAAKRLGQ